MPVPNPEGYGPPVMMNVDIHYGYVYILLALAMFIPALAVTVRRLHDVGKSGWWFFIAFIPLVGAIWLLVLMCTDSVEDNEYGPNPKGEVLEVQ